MFNLDKKPALILAFLLTLLIIVNFYFLSTSGKPIRIKAGILRIIDGDTFVTTDGQAIRLININAPEKNEPLASLSKSFLESFANKSIELEITGQDKYDRLLARVYSPEYLNLKLIQLGLANKFLVDDSELEAFAGAEDIAIKNSLGIWNKSSYYKCINARVDKYLEIVFITNNCPNADSSGWFIKEEGRKKYIFNTPHFTELVIHSGKGINNNSDLFWNNPSDIWNNDRDTVYIKDQQGGLIFYESYGY